ncbi:hypothetical protein HDE76_000032 [Rhodanobacter sp. ANJX3]|uniref:hypothetical protein n=1 Tax=Rhodanobacter sp. ANJX3 TaxID=2723083 RepID=UPI00160B5FFE|nr:hypothetical protein [Rhodanobacter sp. ANJX3]MBB5356850.1 hypothetical protein [Rhodanobacter sp. ANJX3]
MISSDALGKLGEQKFGGWCAEEGLTFNKSDWDRAGWDFTLDFEMGSSPGITLDHRPGAHRCLIQVKTVGHKKNAIRLRLDMAERLAKDSGPSFVVALRVNEAFEVTALHVLPMLDDRLAPVLKRLREASINEGGSLAKKTITFPLTPDTKIGISGRDMKSALTSHVGSDFHSYVMRKQAQMKSLGYEERPFAGTFTLAPELQNDFEKMFLGHEGRVEVGAMEITHTRFGLSEVTAGPESAVLSLKPQPFDKCTVTFRPVDGSPLVFDGDVYLLPPPFGQKMRVHLKLFDLMLVAESLDQLSLSFDLPNKIATPHEWQKFWSAMKTLQQPKTSIELTFQTKSLDNEMRLDGSAAGLDFEAVERACDISAVLDRIAQRAAWRPNVELSWRNILEHKDWFEFIDEIVSGQLTSWTYSARSEVKPETSDPVTVAFVCYVPVGEHVLVCASIAEMKCESFGERLNCSFDDIRLMKSAVVKSDGGLHAFLDRFLRDEKLKNHVVIGPNTGSQRMLDCA